ncbi:MAG: hypothetical protein IT540_08885, partial [Hyphomicrobium sp.]|nr:hypothetical protein [Hyphomicrobium sp.]
MAYQLSQAVRTADGPLVHALPQLKSAPLRGNVVVAKDPHPIEFIYETARRPDIIHGYFAGTPTVVAYRLANIEARGPGGALAGRYSFTYDNAGSSKRTRLTQVQECAGDGACKPPTTFQWTTGPTSFSPVSATGDLDLAPVPNLGGQIAATPMAIDVDADGVNEI